MNVPKSQTYGVYLNIDIASDGVVTATNEAYSITFRCNKNESNLGFFPPPPPYLLNDRQRKRRKNVASVVSYG